MTTTTMQPAPVLLYIDDAEKLYKYASFSVVKSYSTSENGTQERFDVVGHVRGRDVSEVIIELPSKTVADLFADMARTYIAK